MTSVHEQTQMPAMEDTRLFGAVPFVKWAGGKRALIQIITEQAPSEYGNYWEPFVGGGAVFFSMRGRKVLNAAGGGGGGGKSKGRKYVLSDINHELITAYKIIRTDHKELISLLVRHQQEHHQDENYYYKVRGSNPRKGVERAARFIYLNRTCYNGLYRVNSSGGFNVPRGSYENPKICDKVNLRRVSAALQGVTIKHTSFEGINPHKGDFVYCDPPYHGTFTDYVPGGFGEAEQKQLRNKALEWMDKGVYVMLSNSDHEFVRGLYSKEPGFFVHEIEAPRVISANGSGRRPQTELLIKSYK